MNVGSKVIFLSGSRLRRVNDQRQLEQLGMSEGVLIGEHKRGVVQHVLDNGKKYVVLIEDKWYGWVYNFELYENVE